MTSTNLPSVPRVSIVIPVRNGKDFIHEAINSVITQGFLNLEVIVVDDGSNDYDYKQLEDMDPRIRVLRLDGYGVSRARNTGMRVAQGEFIAFLDADDVWFPGKLEAQIHYFDHHRNIGVVFGQFVKWHADSQGVFAPAQSIWSNCADLVRSEADRSGWIYTKLLMGLLVGMNTAVIRRSIYYQIGEFNEAMRIGEDYDFWLRASRVAEMHSLDGPVALYRIHAASAMHKVAHENHMAILLRSADVRWGISNPDETTLIRKKFESRLAATHFGHGYLHFWHGNLEIAKHSFVRALMGGARRGRSILYLAATVARMIISNISRQLN